MLLEHDRLVADIELEDTPEFEIRDPDILPSEKDGYHFACISSRAMLIAEAKEMKHCVAIYADEIISGESVIYSIRGKERATVEFADYGYGFAMCQVYSYYNKEVSAELQLLLSEVGDNNLKIGNRIT